MTLNPLDWFKPVSNLTDSIGEAIDRNVTSDEERLTLRNELTKLKGEFDIESKKVVATIEGEITERWVSDNQGSTLARNVRPGSLIAVLLFTGILIVVDSAVDSFTVRDVYIELLGTLLLIMVPAYFTAREIGKGINLWTARMRK